jgi:hypothetical protein
MHLESMCPLLGYIFLLLLHKTTSVLSAALPEVQNKLKFVYDVEDFTSSSS